MKLSHLSIAIFAAISLAACGGSSSSHDQTTPEDNKPNPQPEQPKPEEPTLTPEEDELIVDPTQTGVVGKLDFSKESSQGTTQYIRGEKSKFDRDNNPSEKTAATSIFGVDLNTQNPWFSNIALARLKPKGSSTTLVQYLGNSDETPSKVGMNTSLQQQNEENVQVLGSRNPVTVAQKDAPTGWREWGFGVPINTTNGSGFKSNSNDLDNEIYPAYASRVVAQKADTPIVGLDDGKAKWNEGTNVPGVDTQLNRVKDFVKAYTDLANNQTLTKDQQKRLDNLLALQEELQDLSDTLTENAAYQTGLLSFIKEGTYRWGDNHATNIDTLDMNFTGDFDADLGKGFTGNPRALGLVGIGFAPSSPNAGYVQGEEEDSKTSTRIFGRYLNALDPSQVAVNSYLGAEGILLHANLSKVETYDGTESADENYAKKVAKDGKGKLKYTMAVQPMKLYDVQYGRVTGNLDPLTLTKKELADGGIVYKRSPYMAKDNRNKKGVDTYFYRGTDATSIEEMNALPKGREMTYMGHALMYGIDNRYHGKVGNAVPSAFGSRGTHGIGNFVIAKVDLDKAKVKGSVYNSWQVDGEKQVYADGLVGFSGNIYGNTVLGEAQRVYNTSDKADFRASFFGDKAQEMGGSINSTTWQERYGAKGDVWGGVFGATRIDEVTTYTNEWLGDIPDLTPAKK